MQFFPFLSETYVSAFSKDEIKEKLYPFIKSNDTPDISPTERIYFQSKTNKEFLFEGWISDSQFRICQYTGFPEQFVPMIYGKIEATSKGCILFLDYRLLKATLFFWIMGIFIFGIIGIIFLFIERNMSSFFLMMLFFLGTYSVLMLNFIQKVKISKQLIKKILE